MRISSPQLHMTLARDFPHVFVLYGNEPFLIEESRTLIRNKIAELGSLDVIHFYGNNLDEASEKALMQPSLFSQIQYVEIVAKKAPALSLFLKQLFTRQLNNTYIVIQGPPNWHGKAAWVDECDKNGLIISHYPLSPKQFESWVQRKATMLGIHLTPFQRDTIVQLCEGNCAQAYAQLEHIHLTQETAPQAAAQQFQLFSLMEAALQGSPERVLTIYQAIREGQTFEIQLILWMLAQSLRTLLQLHCAPQQARKILAKEKIPLQQHALFQQCAPKFAVAILKAALLRLAEIDFSLKTGAAKPLWTEILDQCLKLAAYSKVRKRVRI